tara:strand:- start:15462 stop:16367 length:906 start_codon:yes stop_codon:yes gene_type:complete
LGIVATPLLKSVKPKQLYTNTMYCKIQLHLFLYFNALRTLFKIRIVWLFLGVILGVTGTVASYTFLLPEANTSRSEKSNSSENVISRMTEVMNKTSSTNEEAIISKAQKDVASSIQQIEKNIETEEEKNTVISNNDTVATTEEQTSDSMLIPSISKTKSDDDDVVSVREEMMVAAISCKVIGNAEQKKKTSKADSLLDELGDVSTKDDQQLIMVEFWESPINYKGFKMANHKLLLYGLEVDNNVSLIALNDSLYLHHVNVYYNLKKTFDFTPYRPVSKDYIKVQLDEIRNDNILQISRDGQ